MFVISQNNNKPKDFSTFNKASLLHTVYTNRLRNITPA